jgi:acetylornithine deacetylase/succinyl-diaminopimelate desuccinylase-like protein
MSDQITPVLAQLAANQPAARDRLFDLLRIPSISTDPAYAADCQTAADWLVTDLASIGIEAASRPTTGHSMVVGKVDGPEGSPHVLFYGHYDVQPVDPLNLWDRDPFDPELQDGPKGKVIRARGSADDKGQLMTFVEACRAWKEVHGALPCTITFFFEGEEESGSPSLIPFLETHAAELKADVALICDTGLFDDNTPAITTMLRGLLGEELTIKGPNRDLHSGHYGGAAINPIRVLTRILAGLHDDQGVITVPAFYDGVPEITTEQRDAWQRLGFDPEAFLAAVGLNTPAGEQGRSALEMIWSRPTCEINGIWGGYQGDGFKTVLPAEAHAKVSFRLVGTQDPLAIRKAFRAYVTENLPPDCTAEFGGHGGAPASVMDTSHPIFAAMKESLTDEWPNAAAYIGAGGSIPIAGYFKSILGIDSILAGFGREDDAIHSPNESYALESFEKGARSWVRLLGKM